MQIRFRKFTPLDTIQFAPGQVVDLPAATAKLHIDAGDAVELVAAENATLRHEQTPAFPPTRRKVQKKKVRR